MRRVILLLALGVAGAAPCGWTGPQGGCMVDAGTLHVELVRSGRAFQVRLYDHADRPVDADGTQAVASVGAAKFTLTPSGGNRLDGTTDAGGGQARVLLRVPGRPIAIATIEAP